MLVGSRQAHHEAVITTLSDKIVGIKNESSLFRHKEVRLKMDDALNALQELHEKASNAIAAQSLPPPSTHSASSSAMKEHAKNWSMYLIEPDEWTGMSALAGFATLKRFTEPPPPPPARSLLALAGHKVRGTKPIADENPEDDSLDDDVDFDHPRSKMEYGVHNINSKGISKNNKTPDPVHVVGQSGVMGAKLTREVVVIIDALCGTILKSPTYHNQKMCEYALDCIAVLVTNGYIYGTVGKASNATSNPNAAQDEKENSKEEADGLVSSTEILEFLIETVCKCSDMTWIGTQEGMVRVLLALAVSPRCAVHEIYLLKIVRSIFHVYLVAKDASVKDLAKSALFNITTAVFQRMEAYDIIAKDHALKAARQQEGNSLDKEEEEISTQKQQTLSDVLRVADGVTSINEESSLFGIDDEVEHDADVIRAVANLREHQQNSSGPNQTAIFASQFHTDGYLLFRAICKLSAKSLPEDNADGSLYMRTFGGGGNGVTDPLAFQTKLMSLELLVHVFDHSDEVFVTGERFIYAIQHYLCVSLLKNCMSIHTDVGHAALKIFLVLVYKFKSHLKSEIEVFIANIFLRVLESRSTSHAQKSLVLEALRALCADPQLLTSLFLNYDCDYDAVNLYENIVNSLTRVSRGKVTSRTGSRVELQREADLALYALEVLIVILRAMLSLLDLPGGIPRAEAVENNILLKSLTQLDIGMAAVDAPKIMLQRQGSVNTPTSSSAVRAESMEENFTDTLDRKRTDAQKFDIGSIRFKQSINQGMDFFISENMCEPNAPAIAQFLYQNNDKLDKTQIGELLGREAEFSLIKNETSAEKGGPGIAAALLQSYVQFFDFRDVSIDDAIRDLLSTFRLPGEAQKIDRIMEQFARKYSDENYHHHVTAANPEDIESFNHESSKVEMNADTIFVLSFSIIMLNTDLHNPNIREENRMNEDQFLRNNRGIGTNGSNLPDEYLLQIYQSIAKRPITLREDDDARLMAMQRQKQINFFDFLYGVGGASEEQLREEQRRETDAVMHASYKLFKYSKSSSNSSLLHNQHHNSEIIEAKDAVIPMFEAIWGSLLSALSTQLEASNNRSSTTDALTLCLNGFVYAIRISANTNLDLIRNAYVNGLAKFTLLGNLQEMKRSNLEAIRVLLSIAVMDGEVLCQSWGPILQCVSEVARLRDMATSSSSSSTNKFITSVAESSTEVANSRLVLSAIQDILIDKVFSSTVQLTAKGILHFVEEMIRASKLEMSGADHRGNVGSASSHPLDNNVHSNDLVHISESQLIGAASDNGDATSNLAQLVPAVIIQKFTSKKSRTSRIYCLQKLVEVADYNMDVRPRLVWTQIWELLGKYFVDVCVLSDSADVRAFAMDSLRQLSFKFLRKREFADFNFQRLFLKPFADIMCHKSTSTEIKELLLRCVDAMIRTYGHNLRSGWKVFFGILTKSSSDSSLQVSKLGLAILQRILDEHVHDLCDCYGTPSDQQHSSSSSSHEKSNNNIDVDPKKAVIRNADAQDFISLQRASLSFIPTCDDSNSNNSIPIGLSMRALCHLSCYADLIGCGKVLPPTTILIPGAEDNIDSTYVAVANVPNHDQEFPNDSRKLSRTEAEEMILWRPLLDGLAMGLSSSVSSTSAGVGHIVQRGCIMTLRAILLRHGHVFSYNQWHVILTQILLPSFFKGAMNDDRSNYKNLIGVENGFAYIGSLKALPPSHTSIYLKRFEEGVRRMENAPPRPFGVAELLVEATFADLRQGGDGDIGVLARKLEESNMDAENMQEDEYLQGTDEDDVSEEDEVDFPYPESWIATTCGVCLGTLVDLVNTFILKLEDITGEESYSSMSIWNIIHEFFLKLISGERVVPPKSEATDSEDDVHSMLSGLTNDSLTTRTWYPCEALSTLACHEFARLPSIVSSKYNNEELNDDGRWWKKILASFHDIIGSINEAHTHALQTLMECREAELRMYKTGGIQTPYGPAALVERKRRIEVVTKPRQDLLSNVNFDETAKKLDEITATTAVMVRVLKLEWGATLYEAQLLYVHEESDEKSEDEDDEDNQHHHEQTSFYLNECVPRLKILAATASVMGRNLYQEHCRIHLPRALLEHGDEAFVKSFMTSIRRMCNIAHEAFRNKTLAHAFAEYMRLEWGHDSLLEVEEFLKNTKGLAVPVENQRGGVGMHYLAQEAASTNAYVVYLSSFMLQNYNLELKWDFVSYSEPLLIGQMEQVLSEFMRSERDSQHLHQHQYDPNANFCDVDPCGIRQFYSVDRERNQLVIFSTAFSEVVSEMLGVIKQFDEKRFRENFQVLFPLLCELIEAKQNNIRALLKDIMLKHMSKHSF